MNMPYDRAGSVVLADRRANAADPTDSDADLLEHVVEAVSLDEVIASADLDDEVDVAYLVYLAHHVRPSREQLVELLRLTLDGDLDRDPLPHQHVWLARVRSGDLD